MQPLWQTSFGAAQFDLFKTRNVGDGEMEANEEQEEDGSFRWPTTLSRKAYEPGADVDGDYGALPVLLCLMLALAGCFMFVLTVIEGISSPKVELDLIVPNSRTFSYDPFKNVTAYGQFRIWNANNQKMLDVPTAWLQDDVNKRLKLELGVIGTKSWIADYYFYANRSYVIVPLNMRRTKMTAICKSTAGYGYFEELEQYHKNLRYVGRRVADQSRGVLVHVLNGKISRDDKQELVEVELDEKGIMMVSLKRFSLPRAKYAFLEYRYDQEVKLVRPDDRHFHLPTICSTQAFVVRR